MPAGNLIDANKRTFTFQRSVIKESCTSFGVAVAFVIKVFYPAIKSDRWFRRRRASRRGNSACAGARARGGSEECGGELDGGVHEVVESRSAHFRTPLAREEGEGRAGR